MMPAEAVERRIRFAAMFILLGLVVEGLSLSVLHPLAFVAFASIGLGCFIAGFFIFLLTVLHAGGVRRGGS